MFSGCSALLKFLVPASSQSLHREVGDMCKASLRFEKYW